MAPALTAYPSRRVRRGAIILSGLFLFAAAARATPIEDSYIAGYAAAVLDRDFHLSAPSLAVHDGVITVAASDLAGSRRSQVIDALSRIRGVSRVEVTTVAAQARAPQAVPVPVAAPAAKPAETAAAPRSASGVAVLPGRQLFEPLMADPRWPHFAASFDHINHAPALNSAAAVSLGEVLPLLEDDAPFGGRWQIGLLGAVFSLFDTGSASEDLINSDYFVGVPINWRNGPWSAQARYFHQSSHLGDEFLLRDSGTQRVNISYEQADLRLSYELNDEFRIYGGGGAILRSEPKHEHMLVQGGAEYGADWSFLYGLLRPVAGLDLQAREFQHWQPDVSLRAGVELDSPFQIGRKIQFLLEYYNGKSPFGQFLDENIEYYGIGAHFYF